MALLESSSLNRRNKKIINLILLSSLIFISSFLLFQCNILFNRNYDNIKKENNYDLKCSELLDSDVNLTNSEEIDGKRFYVGDIIPIKGVVYNWTLDNNPLSNVNVSIKVDGTIYHVFNATSNSTGYFQINYVIQTFLNVYSSHKIEVKVTDDLNPYYHNYFTIKVNTSSYFDLNPLEDKPYFTEESFDPNSSLRYDNGSGIPNEIIYYQWKNSTYSFPSRSLTTNSDGSVPILQVPSNASTGYYNLSIVFPTDAPHINGSEVIISKDIPIFTNVTFQWSIPDRTYEGASFNITGELYAKEDPIFKIYNRQLNFYYSGALIGTDTTDGTGNFSLTYIVPAGTGLNNLRVRLKDNDEMYSVRTINVTTNPTTDPVVPPINITPEQLFLVIGVPIIVTASVIVVIAGYLVFKKKTLESKVINIPLENKIKNLKLLKESGRIEEALSYLFSVIYMELVRAKYGRKREDNETIRDFGIISVKEFGLDPAKVYPFIQEVEKFIYSRSSQVSEKEFRNTIELFSPVYYQLTGTTFILNF